MSTGRAEGGGAGAAVAGWVAKGAWPVERVRECIRSDAGWAVWGCEGVWSRMKGVWSRMKGAWPEEMLLVWPRRVATGTILC